MRAPTQGEGPLISRIRASVRCGVLWVPCPKGHTGALRRTRPNKLHGHGLAWGPLVDEPGDIFHCSHGLVVHRRDDVGRADVSARDALQTARGGWSLGCDVG